MQVEWPGAGSIDLAGAKVPEHVLESGHDRRVLVEGDDVEFRVAGLSSLVAAPADVLAAEDGGLRGQCADYLPPCGVIIGLPAFALGMGTVQPDLGNGAVFGQEFEELVEVVLVIVVQLEAESGLVREWAALHLARDGAHGLGTEVAVQAVRRLDLVKVGGGEVDAQFQAVFPAGLREFAKDVALAVLVARGHDAVGGVAGLPEAESVMVLHGEDDHLHAGLLHVTAPFIGVKLLEVEDRGVLESRTPFALREGVGTEMQEPYESVFHGLKLPRCRNEVGRFLNDGFLRVGRVYADGPHICLSVRGGARGGQSQEDWQDSGGRLSHMIDG